MSKHASLICVTALSLLMSNAAPAGEIEAAPGKGTISAAIAKAHKGDVVKLAPGKYEDEVRIPAGLTLLGSGPDKTILTGTAYALLHVDGANVTISGIELRAGGQMVRGVNSDLPVRMERCRFINFPEAVALMGAPLSDVIACEFRKCGIGVRAIGKASPTVWGCRFDGGRMGVFVLGGGPYIRNNLFRNLDEGVRMSSEDIPIIRNNVFWKCRSHGIMLVTGGRAPASSGSIRNNIFADCGDAASGPADRLRGISHCVAYRCGKPPVQVEGEGAAFDLAAKHVILADPDLHLKKSGRLIAGNADVTKGRGVRLPHQPDSEKGDIGLAEGWDTPGCRVPGSTELPPVRFTGPVFIVNSVGEEYVMFSAEGCDLVEQGLSFNKGHPLDTLTVTCDGQECELKFDIERCYGESGF